MKKQCYTSEDNANESQGGQTYHDLLGVLIMILQVLCIYELLSLEVEKRSQAGARQDGVLCEIDDLKCLFYLHE